ncbi:MAG TPA: hypothetical protein VMJ93_07140 [Verrucomicrobiae bacterium]|nr:hypothetical protein [Verrucomicrobiae bacterium]
MKRSTMILALAFAMTFTTLARGAHAQQDEGASGSPPIQADGNAPTGNATAPPGAVPAGARFVIELEDSLDTKTDKAGKPFQAKLIEPLTTLDGRVLPPGAVVRGHVDKCESAHEVGRARLWLTFDEIASPRGPLPLVAELIDAPGTHSVRVAYDHEGEIMAASSKRQDAELAAAAGALAGAATGVATKNGKEAASGAAIGALTAFLITSGLGQEIALPAETKLELVLIRPLLLYTR